MSQEFFRTTLEKLEASQKNEPVSYHVDVGGVDFIVHLGVFSPKYFKSADFFTSHMPVTPEGDFLDIGTGIGTIAIHAALRGARRVVATDISQKACYNAWTNVQKYNLAGKVVVRLGDLFEPIKADERFDDICWNFPFNYMEKPGLTMLERAVIDPGYRDFRRFMEQAPGHLKENGRVLFGFSPTIGNQELFDSILRDNDYDARLIARQEVPADAWQCPIVYQVWEARK